MKKVVEGHLERTGFTSERIFAPKGSSESFTLPTSELYQDEALTCPVNETWPPKGGGVGFCRAEALPVQETREEQKNREFASFYGFPETVTGGLPCGELSTIFGRKTFPQETKVLFRGVKMVQIVHHVHDSIVVELKIPKPKFDGRVLPRSEGMHTEKPLTTDLNADRWPEDLPEGALSVFNRGEKP